MMRKFGAMPTNADPCVYVVDILVFSRNKGKILKLKEYLSQEFEIKDLGEPKYCLGIEFARDGNHIAMRQMGYIRDALEWFGMTDLKPVSTPMDVNVELTKSDQYPEVKERKLSFREMVDAIMYLAVATRPDSTCC
ncbi:uncharacterized mitochondrial protein AtMg00810-like [Belonocnema kinseyi]|uniref:uncharacterized mitochondrial protein AtMg00810-like n=1 Tax=Belonocnema kinseyi TaxID=2817044 RepID=UPI00143D467B|nr:uncharacterized mitochondrial protein AtMg00810-like [Belonocnema kinseyi]